MKAALEYLDRDAYDVVLIIDADNIIMPSYLSEVNDAFAVAGVRVVQTHRIAKNLNTDMAYLDAVSEEINIPFGACQPRYVSCFDRFGNGF